MSYTELITVENFGPYANIPSTSLSEEEKQSTPYADFYEFPINLPPEETIRALMPGNEIDPSKAILPEECDKLFQPGYLECENGYCLLPQGFGFSAVKIDMPEVTPEMIGFWFPWYLANPVHYKTWLPDMHLGMILLDNAHAANEDLGWGAVLPILGSGTRISPETFGINDPTALDPDYVTFFGGSTPNSTPERGVDAEPIGYNTMVNYVRKKGTGIEWRVRCWVGVDYHDGQYTLDSPTAYDVPLIDRIRMVACHNAWEWNRMATLLPAIYKFSQENGLEAPDPRA